MCWSLMTLGMRPSASYLRLRPTPSSAKSGGGLPVPRSVSQEGTCRFSVRLRPDDDALTCTELVGSNLAKNFCRLFRGNSLLYREASNRKDLVRLGRRELIPLRDRTAVIGRRDEDSISLSLVRPERCTGLIQMSNNLALVGPSGTS